jgi:hypothetical protein
MALFLQDNTEQRNQRNHADQKIAVFDIRIAGIPCIGDQYDEKIEM